MREIIVSVGLLWGILSGTWALAKIPNLYSVDPGKQVYRGKEPKGDFSQLIELGITDVLIIKNDLKGEVKSEIEALQQRKIRTHHIPIAWKDIDLTETCEQFVDALKILQKLKEKKRRVYFHCTLGEDRTGALAGLYRMLDQGWSKSQAFKNEMCARGYSDGNPTKPFTITGQLKSGITPIFLRIAKMIEEGKLSKTGCRSIETLAKPLTCKNAI